MRGKYARKGPKIPEDAEPRTADARFLDGQRGICEALAQKIAPIVEIKRAVITAAGKNQRALPLQSLVVRDGAAKTALAIIIEEVLSAGIDEICVVVLPGDQAAYTTAAGKHASRLHFVEQPQPLGYGHAVYCAHEFVEGRPFLLLVGD